MEENVTKPTAVEKFAIFVKEKRQALGMTQPDLAQKVFGDRSYKNYISRVENGKGVSLDMVSRILIKLDSDIEFIE